MRATGIALLFSAGTFLYVSTVHVLPELKRNGELSNPINTPGMEALVGYSHNGNTYVRGLCTLESHEVEKRSTAKSRDVKSDNNGYSGDVYLKTNIAVTPTAARDHKFTRQEIALLLFGCICPIFTSWGHSH